MLVKANLNGNEVEYDDKEFEVVECKYEDNPHFKYLHYIGNGGRVLNPKGNISCYKMFFGCEGLTILDLSNFDTKNVTDMNHMFYGCENLSTLDLSNFNTKNVTDMRCMFFECENLATLDLSSFDTKNVTNMEYMFYWCKSLTTVDLSSFDTRNITDMRYMFYKCESLSTLDLSSFDTKSVIDMYDMFDSCKSLTTLDLSNFDTKNVTDMRNMFRRCKSLTTVDLSNFNTRNVTNMAGMFSGCESLTTVDLSNFNTRNVINMRNMFCWCESLTTLDLSNFDTKNVTDITGMFYRCENLATLDLSSFDTKNVTYMTDMFSGCESLVSVKLNLNNLGSYDTKALKKVILECNIPPLVINSTSEQGIEISIEAYNFIISSPNISPLLSLVREKDYDFNILNVVKNRVKDKNKTDSDFNTWYIKDINGVVVVSTADNSIGFALQKDESMKTRGLNLSKEERTLIKKHLISGITGICDVIGKPLKVITIKKPNEPNVEFTKAYLEESLEERGSWDLFLE